MTPTAAVRSILGDPSGTLSEARCREVVVAVLRAVREPSEKVAANGQWVQLDTVNPPVTLCVEANIRARKIYTAMIDALIEEVTAEAGRGAS
jgi:hypothetical protein